MFTDTQKTKFTTETSVVIFKGRPITLTNRTPILTPEQRAKRKREIESTLYNVVKKYAANQ